MTVSGSGVVRINGGKLTTYRSLAEETLDAVLRDADLSAAGCSTMNAPLPGAQEFDAVRNDLPRSSALSPMSVAHLLSVYGSRARDIDALAAEMRTAGREVNVEHRDAERNS